MRRLIAYCEEGEVDDNLLVSIQLPGSREICAISVPQSEIPDIVDSVNTVLAKEEINFNKYKLLELMVLLLSLYSNGLYSKTGGLFKYFSREE